MGANVNARNTWFGWTPLHFAAQSGHNNVATILIEAGADLDLQAEFNSNGNLTALQIAISKVHSKVVGSLVAGGANVEEQDLFDAILRPDSRWKDQSPDILRHLLSSGASPNVVLEPILRPYNRTTTVVGKRSGDTLLMRSVEKRNLEIFRILLAAGVDLEKKRFSNKTALMLARAGAKEDWGKEDDKKTNNFK